MELVKKALEFEVRKVDETKRILEFVASTPHVDRYGDIIEPGGWDTKDFMRAGPGPFAWAHNYSAPNPGKILKAWVDGNQFKIRVQFASPEEYGDGWPAIYPTPDTVYRLYQAGYLKSVSVGFMPLEREPITDPKQDGRQTGWRYLKSSLYEVSAVVVPANPHANISKSYQEARNNGVVSEEELLILEALAQQKEKPENKNELIKSRLVALEIPEPEGDNWAVSVLALLDLAESQKTRIAELEAQAPVSVSPEALKEAVKGTLEELCAAKKIKITDYYSLALNLGEQPNEGRQAGDSEGKDLAEVLAITKNLHQSIKGG